MVLWIWLDFLGNSHLHVPFDLYEYLSWLPKTRILQIARFRGYLPILKRKLTSVIRNISTSRTFEL